MGAKEDLLTESFLGICQGMRNKYSEKDYRAALEIYRKMPEGHREILKGTFYQSLPEEALTEEKIGEIGY